MKKLFSLTAFCLSLLSSYTYAQCNEYYPLHKGLVWEYESYNAKGKLEGRQLQEVKEFETTADGFKATVAFDLNDEKGKDVMDGDLEMACKNGVFYFDMRKFVPAEQLKALGDAEVQVESENLEYPSSLSPGQSLKDGSITITAIGSAIPMKITMNIVERKVEAIESLATPAGTFETYKITSKAIMKNQMGIAMTFEFENVEWLAKEVGVVKSESFRKGKSNGYTLLVKRN